VVSNGAAQTPVSRRTEDLDRRLRETLAAHQGPAGICPTVPRLAALLGVSVPTVQRALRRLVASGLVERVAVYELPDDEEWQRRGHRMRHKGRQTSNSYRLTPGLQTLDPGLRLTPGPGVTASRETAAHTPVSPDFVTPLEGKDEAVRGYQGVDEGARAPEPFEYSIEPPASAQLDHDPDVPEVLAVVAGAFGPVQVLAGPATYRTARGRHLDLATASGKDLHTAVDQLDTHTCRRTKGGSERCSLHQPCGRHTRRRRGEARTTRPS